MNKMTVMALPENMIESISSRPNKMKQMKFGGAAFFKVAKFQGNLFFYMVSFLLGRLVFLGDLAPFGLGIIAAVAQVGREKAVFACAAVLCGVLSSGRYEEALVYLFSIGCYFKWAPLFTRLEKKMFAVPLTLFITVLLSSFLLNYIHGASLYAYMAAIFNALLCLIASRLFCYGVPLLLDKSLVMKAYQKAANEEMICLIVILALGIAGIGDVVILGYHLQNIFSSILVMCLALAGGAGLGSAVGVIVGLVIGLSGSGDALTMIALYAVNGMIAGIFKPLGKFAVILGYIFGSLMIHLSFTQIPLFMDAVMEAVIAAAILLFLPVSPMLALRDTDRVPFMQPAAVLDGVGAKLQGIADLFYETSGLLGLNNHPGGDKEKINIDRFLGAVGCRVCETCPNRKPCWEENYYRTYQYMLDIFHQLEQAPLSGKDVSLEFRQDCTQAGKVLATINDIVEKHEINAYWQGKFSEQKQVMGEQLKATGNIIMNLAREVNRPLPLQSKHAQVLQKRVHQIGFHIENIKVVHKEKPRRITFEKDCCGRCGECVTYILPIISDYLQEKVTMTRKCGNKELGIKCKICTVAAPTYSVRAAASYIAKEEKGLCGDSVKITELGDGKVSLVLSDGMGSGNKAAKESRLTVECLSKLLLHGFDTDTAVKIVNSMLLLEATEDNFATVDMALIDQYSGEAEFLKIASAPSFLKRVHEVQTIRTKNLPIGILNQIEIEPVKVKLAANDVLIMVSDGIYDLGGIKRHSGDKDGWLVNFIRRSSIEDGQAFADAILQEAIKMAGGKVKDDMSVLVMILRGENFV